MTADGVLLKDGLIDGVDPDLIFLKTGARAMTGDLKCMHITPTLDKQWTLGASTKRFHQLFLGESGISIQEDGYDPYKFEAVWGVFTLWHGENSLWYFDAEATPPIQFVGVKSTMHEIEPVLDATYDIGASAKRWRDLHLSRDAMIGGLAGEGNAYVYVDANGKLYRGAAIP